MPVMHRSGSIFQASDLSAIAHGRNCAGAMGRGIAREFKRRWPRMYAEYRARCAMADFGSETCSSGQKAKKRFLT
jgi:O-acetyl-ADP-ribose deacetylase (regulator of RNase III)